MLNVQNFLNLRKSSHCFMHQEKGPERDLDREFLFNFIKFKKNSNKKGEILLKWARLIWHVIQIGGNLLKRKKRGKNLAANLRLIVNDPIHC